MSAAENRLFEPIFTLGDAVAVTDVPAITINNWLQRKIIEIGTVNRANRRMYSIIDLVKLRIVAEVAPLSGPGFGWAFSNLALPRAIEIMGFDDENRFVARDLPEKHQEYLIGTINREEGQLHVGRCAGNVLPDIYASQVSIVVPLDRLAIETARAALALLQTEELKPEEPEELKPKADGRTLDELVKAALEKREHDRNAS